VKRTYPTYPAQAGFTLVELIVSMAIFIVVLIMASNAFDRIVSQSSKYSKMEESNIEGIIGLEIMRHDLEQMGFGLPWGWSKGNPAASGSTPPSGLIDSTISYLEAVDGNALTLNDSTGGIPRALAASAVLGQFTTAYIALKGSTLGSSKAAQRWTYIPYHNYSAATWESRPVVFASNNLSTSDKVIMVTSNFNNASLDHRLIVDPGDNTSFYQNFSMASMSDNFLPTDDLQTYMVYGVDSDSALRMPFNRADFFIKVPGGVASPDGTTDGTLPPFCAPRTGVLYKATVNHGDGRYRYIPLLDCVADMRVVLGWDLSDGGSVGNVDAYSTPPQADGSVVSSVTGMASTIQGYLTNAKDVREHLKVVKVYLLAQEGKVDPSYTASVASIEVGDHLANGLYPTRMYALSSAQQHYRWKLYRIVVRPKNLSSNQR
jgi:prepilin-type N-terminal cleavage/methylation domain-containing protein